MKLVIFALLVLAAVILASPLDKNKKNEALFKKCDQLCEDVSDRWLCATDGDKINLSFLNDCVLKKYNCERNKILTKKSDGECPGGGKIRIN